MHIVRSRLIYGRHNSHCYVTCVTIAKITIRDLKEAGKQGA